MQDSNKVEIFLWLWPSRSSAGHRTIFISTTQVDEPCITVPLYRSYIFSSFGFAHASNKVIAETQIWKPSLKYKQLFPVNR